MLKVKLLGYGNGTKYLAHFCIDLILTCSRNHHKLEKIKPCFTFDFFFLIQHIFLEFKHLRNLQLCSLTLEWPEIWHNDNNLRTFQSTMLHRATPWKRTFRNQGLGSGDKVHLPGIFGNSVAALPYPWII